MKNNRKELEKNGIHKTNVESLESLNENKSYCIGSRFKTTKVRRKNITTE